MRSRLLDLLACPACRGRLVMALPSSPPADRGRRGDDEIQNGTLACTGCGAGYPVQEGVPCLLPGGDAGNGGDAGRLRLRTARFYGYGWRHSSGNPRVAVGYEAHFDMVAEEVPRQVFEQGVVLDAGCGGGRDLRAMASRWPDIEFVGVDLSEGVYTAQERVAGLPNAHVVRGDLLALPFGQGQFDTVYSYGVLHHTVNPAAGLAELVRVAKPGGRIVTYVYEDFSHSRLGSRLVAMEHAVRRMASRLPPGMLYTLCVLAAPLVFLGFTLPARVLRRLAITRPLAERLPFRHALTPRSLIGDLYDRFVPVCYRFSREAIVGLYRDLGLAEVGTVRRRGWITWGCKRATPAARQRIG
ncbi:MAG: methyltransferase domain-containing protein [Candidatus Rokubacteria bacterium]|nr:methyltransferase domain-containing protein [Candidatus Rokubacteria bacterium]